jgi:RND family efflux transporter MFP subunit
MRKYLTRRNIIIAVVVVLLLGLWWRGRQAAAKKAANAVKVVEVSRGDVELSLSVSGEIKADRQAFLSFAAPGKVSYVGVKAGDTVRKGQILAYLDQGDLNAAVNRTFYAYEAADANAKLIEDQVKGHDADESFTQKNARVAAQTARDTAYDAWLTARRAQQNSQLVAPFAGIVTNVTVNAVGDTASVTDGVEIVDPASLYFSAEVDETDVGSINLNQSVEVALDAYPDATFSAKMAEIGFVSQVSSTGATIYPVKVEFGDQATMQKLRVGMNGDAKIILATRKNVLVLPAEVVVDGEVTLPGPKAVKEKVQTGLEGDMETEIVAGLKEGDKVIVP